MTRPVEPTRWLHGGSTGSPQEAAVAVATLRVWLHGYTACQAVGYTVALRAERGQQ